VIEFHHRDVNKKYWLCECQCPLKTRKIVWGGNLRNGNSRSCGCIKHEYESSPRKKDSPYNNLLYIYKRNARSRKYEFSLTKDQFIKLVASPCFYCGGLPSRVIPYNNGKDNFLYNGIDRKDNSIGYTLGNSVSCCRRCNRMKMAMTESEFLEHIRKIYECQSGKVGQEFNGSLGDCQALLTFA
jgi:hypothetical protein